MLWRQCTMYQRMEDESSCEPAEGGLCQLPVGQQQPVSVDMRQPVVQPGQPIIIIQNTPSMTNVAAYKATQAVILGWCQIVAGTLSIIINAVAIILWVSYSFIGEGIWCGFMVRHVLLWLNLGNNTSGNWTPPPPHRPRGI